MIIIDEHADTKFAKALEALRTNPGVARCIYFYVQDSPDIAGIREKIIASAGRHLSAINPHIYLCADGDIFILVQHVATRDARKLVLDIAEYMQKPASETWCGMGEIALTLNQFLLRIDRKLEKQRHAEIEKKKLVAQHSLERKRQAILHSEIDVSAEEINQRRARREEPALMIIEDDVFSRRLVENTLQKKYALTGLGEADHALAIYAHLAPNLLFLDIDLPNVTGHELLERIIATDPDAYVIMLSGNCDGDNIAQAMSKGAKGFVAKPFTRDKLFQYIDRCPTIRKEERL